MRKVLVVLSVLLVFSALAVNADALKKGDKEFSFAASYSKISFPGDLPNDKITNFTGAMGYLFTDAIEAGLQLSYMKEDQGVYSFSGGTWAVFGQYNFRVNDTMNPYVGVFYGKYLGDDKDRFKSNYGIQAGLKFYPWHNAGFNFFVQYDRIDIERTALPEGISDTKADHLGVAAAVLLKF